MKNLIIDASNYSDIGGKSYGADQMGCNYPVTLDIFSANVTFTQGETVISTDGNFYDLLGGSIENSNVPLYKWICDVGSNGVLFEISHLLSPTTAVITVPAPLSDGTYEFGVIDYFGQPAVEQTWGIDAGSGFAFVANYYTKYGLASIQVGASLAPMGSDPILINMVTYSVTGLNVQYSS